MYQRRLYQRTAFVTIVLLELIDAAILDLIIILDLVAVSKCQRMDLNKR